MTENQNQKYQYLPIKLAVVVTTIAGCAALIVAPFQMPLINFLGLSASVAAAAATLAIASITAYSGFSLLFQSKNTISATFYIVVYSVSVSMQILAIIVALRLLATASNYFAKTKTDFFFTPTQAN